MLFFRAISVLCINNNKSRVVEGKFRCEELKKFLEDHKAKKTIWSSEDATAIVSTCKYDPKTNQIVGLLLPTNQNGCPIPLR